MLNRLAGPTGDAEAAEAQPVNDELAIYGEVHRKSLEALSAFLSASAADIVSRFYAGVSKRPESRRMLERLSKAERHHLEVQQMRNLLRLASPDLTAADHRDLALKVGGIHATLGLDHEDLVHSQALFANAIFRKVDRDLHGDALAVLNQRFARDLAIQTEVYQQMQSARSELVLSIVRITSEGKSYADLMDGVVSAIGQLGEVAGCAAGRLGADGHFHYEAVADGPLHDCIHEMVGITAGLAQHGAAARRDGPATLAWRTGAVQRAINVATDAGVEPWRDALLRGGFRSLVAIPLCRIGDMPQAVLCIFSALPGGFSGAEQQDFIAVIRTLIEFAMTRITHVEGGTHAVSFSERQRWSALLRSDALQMHYQPILDLKTRRVAKVEALARLQDGARLLAPGLFLPTLSRDDFFELFARGLHQALAQRNQWLRDGIDLDISLNLPPIGLSDPRYFEATRDALRHHACAPQRLTLEVLETEEVQGAQSSNGVARFKALGVSLAQDDLGAGHSSLNRLRALPFDYIKIDKEIVRLEGNDSSDILRFVYQITRLAHSLGRTVVVEGVEDQGLVDAFVVLGVDLVQGYGVARPMPAQQLRDWMRTHAAPFAARSSASRLGNLARLLIWEETVYLDSEVRRATSSGIGGRSRRSVKARRVGIPFQDSSIMLDRVLPGVAHSPARRALLDAAEHHGVGSKAYQSARSSLIAEI
ncbi:hypothetical protein LMG27952_06661 [Paraburkholderia hiiakae]|uniref:EAL domain-containing protein n=1 Tax=Paraburkholderia hiiakae TaxID=1081782 RepID=A0ABM8P7W0_9BURK|nr:EAL domain-containing protein [Paraburkholderia hiiakae]CAD6558638.1 hypothetical protein LMG27952_06661 [Paraburkholderia hiiakae]